MRVIHVVSDVIEASGSAHVVLRLCESLIEGGLTARIAALGNPSVGAHPYLDIFPRGRGPKRYGFSPQMRRWLDGRAATGQVDLIHSHSLWTMPNVYPGR